MAMIQCPDCYATLSDSARECPHCGSTKLRVPLMMWVALGIVGFFASLMVYMMVMVLTRA